MYVCNPHISKCPAPVNHIGAFPYINLPILKPLLQILVDRFIRDLANQREIRDSNLLLLRRIEMRFLDVRLAAAGRCGAAS
jgi:hypothetical protein